MMAGRTMGRMEKTSFLSSGQRAAVRELEKICREQDGIRLSYPAGQDEAECHYLLWESRGGKLISALAFVPYDDQTAECVAFTHPQRRKQGCFTRLLNQAIEEHEDMDLLFPVSGSCGDTLAALAALGAEEESREYQMERELAGEAQMEEAGVQAGELDIQMGKAGAPAGETGDRSGVFVRAEAGENLIFYPWGTGGEAAGALQTTPVSGQEVCLHHVEIYPRFRGKGLGERMLRLLLETLAGNGVKTVVLQVSADNASALRLYEKTGFRITETLSYYWF